MAAQESAAGTETPRTRAAQLPHGPPHGSVRRLGTDEAYRYLTTDANLVIRSWDAVLERMTGVEAEKACGQPLALLAPEADARGVLALLRDTLESGAVTVLAPAIHHFLIASTQSNPPASSIACSSAWWSRR